MFLVGIPTVPNLAALRTESQILHLPAFGYAFALLTVAAVSWLIGLLGGRSQLANVSILYLLAVLATASAFGRGPAVLASLSAFVTFNWFFVEPVHTLTVADPGEWVSLILFLLTAVVTGQLAAGQRRRAEEAGHREREANALYNVARLMAEPDLAGALKALANQLRRDLRLSAAVIEVSDGPLEARAAAGEATSLRHANPMAAVPTEVFGEAGGAGVGQPSVPSRWVRIIRPQAPGGEPVIANERLLIVPITVLGRRVGSLLLVRPSRATRFGEADDRLLSAVAAQLGSAVERIRLGEEATEAEILRRTDETKSALLHAVSHDLRTPLASIVASAGSLRQQEIAWSDDERRELAEAIEHEAQRLNGIVGNLLDVSRIESGSLKPERSWHDVGALIDDVVGALVLGPHLGDLVLDIDPTLPPVLLDYVQIQQVLFNLIENATKYSAPGTPIAISARSVGDAVEVEVADRGPGIPENALPRLFDPFYRGQGATRAAGTGLGLAVARGFVQANGGRIWCENRPQGGASFKFHLPIAHASLPEVTR